MYSNTKIIINASNLKFAALNKVEIINIKGVALLVGELGMSIKKKWLSHDNQSPLLTLNLIP